MPPPPTIVWFRRDLRVADNPALRLAADEGPVVCLFVHDPELVGRRHHAAPARRAFLRDGLVALDRDLRARGSSLTIRSGDPRSVLVEVAEQCLARRVIWATDVSPFARRRDEAVSRSLVENGIEVLRMPTDCVAQPQDIANSTGDPYRVFTPFWHRWRDCALPAHDPGPTNLSGPDLATESASLLGDAPSRVPAGEAAARTVLVDFIREGRADRYDDDRDTPSLDGTTRLGPYLRFGMCTTAQIGRALQIPATRHDGRWELWRQLCWREFYQHHLWWFPRVARGAFRTDLDTVEWDDGEDLFDAWCAGRTGYPLVDAGMRQLMSEGWMHNRARMVAASFLVKDLHVDWRRGETVFMQRLLDGDPANNNGGWQWVAGTGTDAAPYFRVLSPVRQAQRFDPEGHYVRRYIPELARVPDRHIFEPWRMGPEDQDRAGCRIGVDYPAPIVDHAVERIEAVERYRAARNAAEGPD